MTKESYFDMCDTLGADPIEDQIPVEYDDLHIDTQIALDIFNMLPDNIDTFSGHCFGKDLTTLMTILDIYEIEDRAVVFETILYIMGLYANAYNKQNKKKALT